MSTCTAERGFSSKKRLITPPRSTMTDEGLSFLAILHIHWHKDVDTDAGVKTEFARSEGQMSCPLLLRRLMALMFAFLFLFFRNTVAYRKH